jgi:hypothetical protein
LGVKISLNATVKYATTIKAALNIKFLGLNDKNISENSQKLSLNLMKITNLVFSVIFYKIEPKFADAL